MKRITAAFRHAVLASACACGLATAAFAAPPPVAPGGHVPVSPGQPHPRKGDYHVLEIGSSIIRARCDEGGFTFVARHPEPGHEAKPVKGVAPPPGITRERDAALREACSQVDYTK